MLATILSIFQPVNKFDLMLSCIGIALDFTKATFKAVYRFKRYNATTAQRYTQVSIRTSPTIKCNFSFILIVISISIFLRIQILYIFIQPLLSNIVNQLLPVISKIVKYLFIRHIFACPPDNRIEPQLFRTCFSLLFVFRIHIFSNYSVNGRPINWFISVSLAPLN